MTSPLKPWNSNNETQVLRSSNPNPVIPQVGGTRNVPLLPPRPSSTSTTPMNSYGFGSPYSSMGYGYGNSYGSFGYRSPMYSSYGYGNSYGYSNPGMYGMDGYSSFGPRDDAERRFIQFAEESSRNTFANVESIVRAVNSISMMLDNTFFAMTSSFRAVLSVAENFGRLRSMFGHIWYSLNVFRLFKWLYRRLMRLMGYKVMDSAASVAWNEAHNGAAAVVASGEGSGGFNWPTIAFFGVLISTPYLISKYLLPKYEGKIFFYL
ncbi:hypothetical protein ILUMI_26482 [Ignelater luminosus]|uniref:Peroxin-13 n=1 Tax=Ignelater luminosus TaxID=2038154 RepID=A0A8K0FYL6_IGNLU|nr:hypothetical protein ILUMI_26482 [Ignelater luminosus]